MSEERNLRHYYLQQMGIVPWILRNKRIEHKTKLMIVTDDLAVIDEKAINLLELMMRSIGLLQEEFLIAKSHLLSESLIQEITTLQPQIILVLSGLTEKVYDFGKIPVVTTFRPDYLLTHPLDKKKAYIHLLKIKRLME